jgi:hypothetical protein
MLSTANNALVAGGMRAPAAAPAAPLLLRVVRAVMVGGVRAEPGQTLAVDRWLAAELVSAGKAERIAPSAAAPPPPKPPAASPPNRKEKPHVEQ